MAFCGFAKGAAMYDTTPIENMFLMEHLPAAPAQYVKVYLYARMLCLHPELGGTAADVAAMLRMDEDAVLREIGKLIASHPGDRDVLIYKRNGQILSSGKKGGVSATLDFAEEAALLLGNYNVKIMKLDR